MKSVDIIANMKTVPLTSSINEPHPNIFQRLWDTVNHEIATFMHAYEDDMHSTSAPTEEEVCEEIAFNVAATPMLYWENTYRM